jgi:hypothetical protein
VLGPQQAIEECVPCPTDTYSSTNFTVYIPQLPLAQQCTPCPQNAHTAGPGTSSLKGCACIGSNNGTGACQLCTADQYFEPTTRTCNACPGGTTSAAFSIGINACLCPQGHRATMRNANSRTLVCEPCPAGFFSSSLGASCATCPPGMTTLAPGATSRLQCVDKQGA